MRTRLIWLGLGLLLVGCTTDESRCEDICVTLDDCDELASQIDVEDCIDECVKSAEDADDKCTEAFEEVSDCVSEADNDCDDVFGDDRAGGDCDDEIEDFADDCDDDFEDFFDEIGASGDACTSAAGNTCGFAFDLECDEPGGTGICATGTDTYDCDCI